jgi:hypothetical protein
MIVIPLLGIGIIDTEEEDCAEAHRVSRAKGKRDMREGIMRKCDAERKTSYRCTQMSSNVSINNVGFGDLRDGLHNRRACLDTFSLRPVWKAR